MWCGVLHVIEINDMVIDYRCHCSTGSLMRCVGIFFAFRQDHDFPTSTGATDSGVPECGLAKGRQMFLKCSWKHL